MSLKAAFDQLVTALKNRDVIALEDALTEDFRFTSTSACHQHKAQRIAAIVANPVFKSLQFRNVEFEPLSGACLVFAEFQYASLEPGILYFGRSTFVFAQQADLWKLKAQHNSHAQSELSV